MGRIGPVVCVALSWLAMCTANSLLPAQTLRIASPADGAVVNSGQALTVIVSASPPGAFQAVGLLVGSPLECDQVLGVPPYQFTIQIPPDVASRSYALVAMGLIAPGQGADSEPISIKVERSDSPQQLKAGPSMLLFDYIGQEGQSRVYGSFADGSEVDLTYSSLITYTSDAPGVATVDDNAEVTAVGPGTANILVSYVGTTIQVPVEVPPFLKILPSTI
jgi:hypothetical protein